MTVNSVSESNLFDNPNNLPLGNLKLTTKNNGIVRTVDALSSHWVENRTLSFYVALPDKSKQVMGTLETWKDTMRHLIDDLKWLLSMEYHEFWSHIAYHPSCMNMLVSFLQDARPPYMPAFEDGSIVNLYNEVYRRVLIIFSRLVTNKESENKWMEKSHMAEVLYEKYIFTIPIIWDLCLIYGVSNRAHISKLIDAVFYLQPKYYEDLEIAVDFLKKVYEYISVRIDRNPSNLLPEAFKGFSENFSGRQTQTLNSSDDLSFSTLYDFILHIFDSAISMRLFLDLHPPARKIFREKEFYSTIVNFYDGTIVKMYERIKEFVDFDENSLKSASNYLDMMRMELLDSFRLILSSAIDEILSGNNIEKNVDIYLTIITDALSEKHFVKDYHSLYPIEVDLDILCQAYSDMDPVKCDFILQAVYANCDEKKRKVVKFTKKTEANEIPNGEQNHSGSQSPVVNSNDIPEEAKTHSLISEVRDILPDLGDGYILKCLEFYGFNTERVINCILEGNLDKSLQDIDPQLPIIPSDPLDEQYLKTGIDRRNVFDNDEFDVMTKDNIDMSRVYRGKKKSKHKNLSEMLNDKSYVKQMKNTYTKYSLISEEADLYDDEYDDTYDDAARDLVGETVSEMDRKPLSTKTISFKDVENNQEESGEESDENTASSQSDGRVADPNHFCANPEELRARYQARREQKYGHKSNVERDVVGRAKGQGQDKDVLLNRRKKEANKTFKGNHNRRSGAQWKRSQGIVPS